MKLKGKGWGKVFVSCDCPIFFIFVWLYGVIFGLWKGK